MIWRERMSKDKKKSMAKYFIGSIILACISMIVIPKIIEAVSSILYSKMPRKIAQDDDDWGPEIVKRTERENNK